MTTHNTHHVMTETKSKSGKPLLYVRSTIGECLEVVAARAKGDQFDNSKVKADTSASKKPSKSWDLNCNLSKAITLGATGWGEGQKAMDSLKGEIQHVETSKGGPRKTRHNFTGGAPSVGRYLTGQPKFYRQQVRTSRPKLDLFMSISVHCQWTGDEFLNRGLAMLKVIERYEDRGYDVLLTAHITSNYDKDGEDAFMCFEIPLKAAGMVLDKDLVMFAMAHPAFFRRIGFSMIEYFAPESTAGGYGRSVTDNTSLAVALGAKILEGNEIYLSSDSENERYNTTQNAFDRLVYLIEKQITTGKKLAA